MKNCMRVITAGVMVLATTVGAGELGVGKDNDIPDSGEAPASDSVLDPTEAFFRGISEWLSVEER